MQFACQSQKYVFLVLIFKKNASFKQIYINVFALLFLSSRYCSLGWVDFGSVQEMKALQKNNILICLDFPIYLLHEPHKWINYIWFFKHFRISEANFWKFSNFFVSKRLIIWFEAGKDISVQIRNCTPIKELSNSYQLMFCGSKIEPPYRLHRLYVSLYKYNPFAAIGIFFIA